MQGTSVVPFFVRPYCLFLVVAAAVSLLFALFLQYGLGYQPCAMCVQERWVFLGLGVVAAIGFLFRRPRAGVGVALLVLIGLAALTLYHVGIERGWFQLTAACTGAGQAHSVDELRALLQNAKPTCDRPAWIVQDVLSLAELTLFWALALLAATAWVAAKAFRR